MSTAILEAEVAGREATQPEATAEASPTAAQVPQPQGLRGALAQAQPGELDEDEVLYEIEYGRRVEVPMGVATTFLAYHTSQKLGSHVQNNQLGWVVPECLFILDKDKNLRRRPDVAFVSAQRWPLDKPLPAQGDWPVVPDLTVEVISPADTMERIARKVGEYFRYGVRLVWLVLPMLKQVYVYRSHTQVRILSEQEELDGGEVLPGFRVKLAELFAAVPMEQATE